MPVSKEEFRRAMGHFASGVTVVTTRAADDTPQGMTVSAFLSLSLEPPLVLVSIDRRSSLHEHLTPGRHFAVNMLAEDQELISRRFAARDVDRFAGVGYIEGIAGVPLLDGALTQVECVITDVLPGGDHSLVIGQVEATHVREGRPLLYFRGGYAQLG